MGRGFSGAEIAAPCDPSPGAGSGLHFEGIVCIFMAVDTFALPLAGRAFFWMTAAALTSRSEVNSDLCFFHGVTLPVKASLRFFCWGLVAISVVMNTSGLSAVSTTMKRAMVRNVWHSVQTFSTNSS